PVGAAAWRALRRGACRHSTTARRGGRAPTGWRESCIVHAAALFFTPMRAISTQTAGNREPPPAKQALATRYREVRACSLAMAAPLSAEDAMLQSMPDASPAKWHLAHTTWFFEKFVLGADKAYVPVEPRWDLLFNSYYNSVGPFHVRAR